MTTSLLDVNALIALVYEDHVSHLSVKRWFQRVGARQWATCPLPEASFVRIVSNPKFSKHPIDVGEAMHMLSVLRGHHFWTTELSFNDAVKPFVERLFWSSASYRCLPAWSGHKEEWAVW